MSNWKETKCGKCKIQRAKPICNTCEGFNKFIPMTNAQHIQTMSIEELAEFLSTLFIEGQIEAIHEQYPDSVFNRKDSSLKWLQSEVEE